VFTDYALRQRFDILPGSQNAERAVRVVATRVVSKCGRQPLNQQRADRDCEGPDEPSGRV